MDVIGSQWMDKGPWYNTTICTKLNGQIFKDYFKTGRKDRYEFMCAVDVYVVVVSGLQAVCHARNYEAVEFQPRTVDNSAP